MNAWHMVGPRADKIITAAIFITVAPIFGYNIISAGLKPFAYAGTEVKHPMSSLSWLQVPCENHWMGYKGFPGLRPGEHSWMWVCLTKDGWAMKPLDRDTLD